MNTARLVGGVSLAAALAVFGVQNTQSVSLHFLGWDTRSVPVVLALASAVLLGVLIGWLVSIPGRVHGMLQRRDLQHQIDVQEQRAPTAEEPKRSA